MKTRKELCNENMKMRAQLDVYEHVSRVALNVRVKDAESHAKLMERECEAARMELTNVQAQARTMRAELQRLAAAKEA